MKGRKKKYSLSEMLSAVFMIAALCWLTVSTPFVYAAQQEIAKQSASARGNDSITANEEESSNPFGNNTEEKAPNSTTSFSEEFLHEHHFTHHLFFENFDWHKGDDARAYVAFHGELLVPPPNRG